jgi:hypothetical protein
LNSFRTKFIIGFSVFMGFSIPQYFKEHTAIKHYGPVHTNARWVNYPPSLILVFLIAKCNILKTGSQIKSVRLLGHGTWLT